MKRTIQTLAVASLALLWATSCTKATQEVDQPTDVVINLSTYELRFTSPSDSTIDVSVEANADWVALKEGDNGADWLTITPSEGTSGIEATTMSVHVTENTTSAERMALIRVSSKKGNVTKELTLTQFPALSKLGQDSMILVNFYEATEGWKWKTPWMLEDPISMWPGVTVAIGDGELRVTRLDFQNQNIKGAIPDDFQYLDQLVFFQTYANSHAGKLPEWLPKLKKLKEFCVASCGMSGPIPESYWDMTQLVQMRLETNGFTGPLSEKIGQLVNLDNISMDGNPIRGAVPKAIGQMTNLRDINLFGCGMTGELPAEIGNAPKLENIRFDDNKELTGEIPEQWGNISTLKIINVSGTGITKLPASLYKCDQFWELSMEGCAIEEIPQEWINAKGLEYIRAENSGLTSLPQWESHPSLTSVNITGCQVEGPIPPFTGSLAYAIFSGNRFTGGIPESVVKTTRLQSLYLNNCTFLAGEVPTELWLRQSFTHIDLAHTGFYGKLPTDDQYGSIALALQTIDLEDCKFDGPIPSKLFEIPSLQTVNLKNNNFTGTVPTSIGYTTGLKNLFLSGNRLSGVFPEEVKRAEGWSSINMWDPVNNICPQQEGPGWGFEGTSCTDNAPTE